MRVLVLRPEMNTLFLSVYESQNKTALLETSLTDYIDYLGQPEKFSAWVSREVTEKVTVDLICVRCISGAAESQLEWVSQKTICRLEQLVSSSPIHLPRILGLIENLQCSVLSSPILLLFEDAFFDTLPAREVIYAIEHGQAKQLGIERVGFHGLFHAAACGASLHFKECSPIRTLPRIISICLEPISEIAGVCGSRVLTTSSGMTVLEGFMGEKSCGQIDPGIVLDIARKMNWGPEKISLMLTQESGLSALVKEKTTLDDIFKSQTKPSRLARSIFEYQLIQHCGAAIAAMGGCDKIVFSGKYAALGEILGPWLLTICKNIMRYQQKQIEYEIIYTSIDRICADMASAVFHSQYKKPKAS